MSESKQRFFKKFEGLNSIFCIQLLAMFKCNDFFRKPLLIDEKIFSTEKHLVAYIFQSDVDRIRDFIFGELKKNPLYLDDINEEALSDFKKFNEKEADFVNSIENIESQDVLKQWMKDFVEEASFATRLGFVAELFVGYEDFWPAYINVSKEDFRILTAPEELSFTKMFDYEIAKIKLGTSDMAISDMVSRYHWILSSYNAVDLVNEKYVSDHLSSMSIESARNIVDESKNYLSNIDKEKSHLYKTLKVDEKRKRLLSAIASFVVLQDKRKEVILKTNSIFLRVANKLLDMYGIHDENRSIIISAAHPLWFSDMDKKELLSMSKEAFKCFYFPYTGEIKIGAEAIKEYEDESRKDEVSGEKELKGRTAYPGSVRGKVIKILKNIDFDKFEKGAVLVTSITRPEYVPLMKKAAAIITDEGGITCHAAIISRELKKPCIIGTKIATQVLKTGDMVEVDADKGIVRIVS